MSGTLKPYPKYKESGVEWLGAVPEGWAVDRLKWSASLVKNGDWGNEPADNDDALICVRVADFDRTNQSVVFNDPTYRVVKNAEERDVLLHSGDLILEKSGGGDNWPVGFVVRFDHPERAVCSNFTARISASEIVSNRLMKYVHRDLYYKGVNTTCIKQNTGIQNLDGQVYFDTLIAYPPLPEQQAIADYLDAETKRIDTLIAELREMIRLLKEKRQALISHCVTKGLDPTVPMKDSGVEWLGEVPEGWEVVSFRLAVTITEGQVDPTMEPYSSMNLVGSNHIVGGMGMLLPLQTAVEQGAISGKYYAPAGSVLYSKIRPSLRKVARAPHAVLCSADIYPMNGDDSRLTNRFLNYLLLSDGFSDFAINESDRVAMPKINRESLASFRMPLPPLPEQQLLADYLDRETAKIDRLISETEETITLMQERRSALISSVVTGKLQVPGVPQPSGSTLNSRTEKLP